MNSSFIGTGVALVTPFKEDFSIDFDGLKKLIQHVSQGVDYLVVNGTTAESATTSEEEKAEILSFVKKENKKNLPIMLGIGGNNTAEILKKIKQTDFSGIGAILSVCPYYNKPSQEGIYQHYKVIAEACPVPVLLYNVPGRTGVNMKPSTVARLAEIKNIIGIKEAAGDIIQALEMSRISRKDFMLISGDDMLTSPMISFGAKGVISVIANGYPVQFGEMVRLALKNEFGKSSDIQRSFCDINPLLYEESNPVGIKLVLSELGVCSSVVRLPLYKGSESLTQRIKAEVKKLK
jgi:4-hydroxy-tetrahydrodipicolinate synthase